MFFTFFNVYLFLFERFYIYARRDAEAELT